MIATTIRLHLRQSIWIALVLVLLGGCATTSVLNGLHETATASNREGLALLEQDAFKSAQTRFSNAISLLEQVLATCEDTGDCDRQTLEPVRDNLATAYTNRAYTRMHLGGMDELALADLDRALELAPDRVEPHQYRAVIAIRSLDEAAAWEEYLYLRERDPAFADELFQAYEEAFGPRLPETTGSR
jgi:Tfp pilus assembly protein PilF